MRSVHGRGRDRYADLLLRPRARRLLERRQQPAVRLPVGDAPCRGRQHCHAARRRARRVGRVHLHGDREPDRRRARPQPRLQGVRLQRASRLGGRAGAGRPAARRRRDGAAKVRAGRGGPVVQLLSPQRTGRPPPHRCSSSVFISTNLAYKLRNLGCEQVVLVGGLTDQCVDSAVRDACDLGARPHPRSPEIALDRPRSPAIAAEM